VNGPVAGRAVLVLVVLGALLAGSTALAPATGEPSELATLAYRIAAGVVISVVAVGLIAVLVRADGRWTMADVGLGDVRAGWRLALWGAGLWLVPAAATFGVLAVLGTPLSVAVPVAELVSTVSLLLLAVLLTEALPEEAVFRGYLTTALGTTLRGWWVVVVQALLFTLFAAILRQDWNPTDLSLFLTMGIAFGYLRMVTGTVWMSVGSHTAFQTGAQLVLTHDVVDFAGGTAVAMLALGVVPFTVAAIVLSSTPAARWVPAALRTPGGGQPVL